MGSTGYCTTKIPIISATACLDTGSSDISGILGSGSSSLTIPDGFITYSDLIRSWIYTHSVTVKDLLSYCFAPCRDPRTVPPPVPVAPLRVVKPSGLKR